MTVVLALDVAKNITGWAMGGPDWDKPVYGVFETANWDGRQGYNLVNFRKFLDARANSFQITHLVLEQVFVDVRGAYSKAFDFSGTQAQMFLCGVAVEWAESRGIKQMGANIADWRARFLGMSRRPKDAGKDAMFWKNLALRRAAELNLWCQHHDEAEAIGILDFALAALDPAYRRRTDPRYRRAQNDIDLKRGIHA